MKPYERPVSSTKARMLEPRSYSSLSFERTRILAAPVTCFLFVSFETDVMGQPLCPRQVVILVPVAGDARSGWLRAETKMPMLQRRVFGKSAIIVY
ncbi:hypothetical protein NQK81_22210 [Amycolatopsis roodepoortensis]|uniref:hypothetical protein n=1 Tax=Amycolatopsis roodepoortensis TaxID=700274 RepID=UPI00214C9138|nr:hypothetical protein [Amycolatopsis roodepoortensis]UUV36504.1 hypothetical protein NQK81_27530 [Amycolatopsis roodepoortensis]UUV36515.1 hypothetical protein NQK81_22210 [Amycolatopsis roodepoortensis]